MNLSYDYDTITAYANELGYIKDGQIMIKLQDLQGNENHDFNPGQYLTLPEITYMSDAVIKSIALSVGIIVLLIEMLLAYKKQNETKVEYDYTNRQRILFP